MIGRSNEVAAMVMKKPALLGDLIASFSDPDPLVRMRAADAAEKASRSKTEILWPFKSTLLRLLAQARQQELRWHLALMVPRLVLSVRERQSVASQLACYLRDRSSLVRTCAMQGLADLAKHEPGLRPRAIKLLRKCTQSGTPAMKARGRKLLLQLERL